MLLAALQALVVEYEVTFNSSNASGSVDINSQAFAQRCHISGELLENLNDLTELRNEIIPPAHASTGSPDNWPTYLARIKAMGLLESTERRITTTSF